MIYILIFLLIITYILPLSVYRYLIRKAPVERKRAKTILELYALILAALLSLVFRAPALMGIVWIGLIALSYVNYRILTGGKLKPDITVELEDMQNIEIVYEDLDYEVSESSGSKKEKNDKGSK